jgi:predicted nucleotidyltransferase
MPSSHPPLDHALAADGSVVATLRAAFPNVLAMYVFGSRAQGTARADSDLDLAVLVAGYADPLQLWDVSAELAALVGCPVDLLDLRAASTVMQYQVLTGGHRLWGDALAAGLFECYVMSEKLQLDQARSGYLADIAQTGKIHG